MKLDILAITAHPDDVELTCGGTLIKMADAGYKTGVLDLTAGEMGTRGTPETRAREAAAAAKVLGLAQRDNLGLPDARLEASTENKLKVAQVLRRLRPQIVILPYWEGRHPDHYTCSKLAYEACYLSGLKKIALEGKPFRPFKILYSTMYYDVRPSFVVDISKEFERRHKAIMCYESQFAGTGEANEDVHIPLDEIKERVTATVRQYGLMIGTRYGEPFLVREMIQVDDVTKLTVRSI